MWSDSDGSDREEEEGTFNPSLHGSVKLDMPSPSSRDAQDDADCQLAGIFNPVEARQLRRLETVGLRNSPECLSRANSMREELGRIGLRQNPKRHSLIA